MIKLVNTDNNTILILADLLHSLYLEVYPNEASIDPSVYITEIIRCLNDPKQAVYMDSDNKGFFIVVDETEPMTPSMKIYNGTRVYIKPEYRNSKLLKEFYNTMFKDYPEGSILGLTEINSKHIKVLEKRHTRIANLYRLTRS